MASLRQFVDLHYTWLQRFFNFKDMMKRLTIRVLVQFFLNFLMATLLFMVGPFFSFCRISRNLHIFPFLSWFFLSNIRTVLIYVLDFCLSIQRTGCPLMSFISMIFKSSESGRRKASTVPVKT